ncbi:thiol-disulfide oxidoreductase DCC family protein [Limnohabitans sp. 2KL-1]|uniref:thiol-disulfide oxidoreductase DCC family protein n=1 Tax=Limnohabitans sp. 2KL-1 TaxID=1100699 RepID=UPI001E501461|nr:DUF393 domain-containing protein [Limnohabitans sp. 2KL-1]
MNNEPDPHMTCPAAPQAHSTADGPSGCSTLTVMFDGSCPLCQREIGLYRSLTPLQPVVWVDVSQAELTAPVRAQLMARFHVQQSNGQMLSGAAAFVALWLHMPGWRWLGRLGRLPGMTPLMEWVYRAFLTIRPGLQRLFKKRFET